MQGDPSWCGLDLSEAFAAGHALADQRESVEQAFRAGHPGMSAPLARAVLAGFEAVEERAVADVVQAMRKVAEQGEPLSLLRAVALELFLRGFVAGLGQ